MAYSGKNWDISSFVATPSNVAALEKDAELLFNSVQRVYPISDSWKNWIGIFAVNYVTAHLNRNSALVDSCTQGFLQVRNSGSWKLKVLSMVILSAQFAAMVPGFGTPEKPFLDAVKEFGIESPRTAAEKNYFDLAATASVIINHTLVKALKQAMGRG